MPPPLSLPSPPFVALETTLLAHGVPKGQGLPLAQRLAQTIRARGAEPAVVAVIGGIAKAHLSDDELARLLELSAAADPIGGGGGVRKVNTANLGVALFRKLNAATTVSTTMELAARAGLHVFATGGLGGVHHPAAPASNAFDISADLHALTRFPVCVVASGVKSILDVPATREVLETLGVPVIGFQTEDFPCFYLRSHPDTRVNPCDARFDDPAELASFVRFEMARTNRAVLVVNPIPKQHEIKPDQWRTWLSAAEAKVKSLADAAGRDATPALLAALHEVSQGATLKANIELVVNNADLAAQIAVAMRR